MNEIRKPIGESEFGANDGEGTATHYVTVWLENDQRLAEAAQRMAQGGEGVLRRYVASVLYGSPAGFTTDELHTLQNVRDGFTREDFDGIDWSAVRDSLLAE